MDIIYEQGDVLVLLEALERLWKIQQEGIVSESEFKTKKAEIMNQLTVIFDGPIYAEDSYEEDAFSALDNENAFPETVSANNFYETEETADTIEEPISALQTRKLSDSRRTIGVVLCVLSAILLLFTAVRYPIKANRLSELADDYRESGLYSYRQADDSSLLSGYYYIDARENFEMATEMLEKRRATIIEGCLLGGVAICAGVAGVVCIRKKDGQAHNE